MKCVSWRRDPSQAAHEETQRATAALDEDAAAVKQQVAQAQRAQRALQEQRAQLQQALKVGLSHTHSGTSDTQRKEHVSMFPHQALQQQLAAAISERLQHQRGASQRLQQLKAAQEATQAEEAAAGRLESDMAAAAQHTANAQVGHAVTGSNSRPTRNT